MKKTLSVFTLTILTTFAAAADYTCSCFRDNRHNGGELVFLGQTESDSLSDSRRNCENAYPTASVPKCYENSRASSGSIVIAPSSPEPYFFRVDWRTKGYSCDDLRVKYPSQSFITAALIEKEKNGNAETLTISNPQICLSDRLQKQFQPTVDKSQSVKWGIFALDIFTANYICKQFGLKEVENIRTRTLRSNIVLYKLEAQAKVKAVNAGSNPNDPTESLLGFMGEITCMDAHSITEFDMNRMQPIELK